MKKCCVTGHREIAEEKRNYIISELREEIKNALRDGYNCFISGFAQGVDLLFAEIVAELKRSNPDIILEAALPYYDRLKTKDENFQRLIKQCSSIKICSEKYTRECFLKRDRYVVDSSNRVIAVYDGRVGGGTYYTLKYAKEHEKDIRIIPLKKH